MPGTEVWLAVVMFAALVAYVLFGGADFGGGIWDLLASGPRRDQQRRAVASAIGPIWEANHVWLILAIVLLFSGFPRAFGAMATALHIPLTLFLLGVVLRGSAFAFRGLDAVDDRRQRRWGLMFSLSSAGAPLFLGACVGALASGQIRLKDGLVTSGFVTTWLAPFPIAVGVLCLACCAYLAAVYLLVEVQGSELEEDFRRRALMAAVAVGVAAFTALWLSRTGAPLVHRALTGRPPSVLLQGLGAALAIGAFIAIGTRRYRWARLLGATHVTVILAGWAAGQYPFLLVPDVTLAQAAAPARARAWLLGALAAGTPVLAPSLWLLFRIFKARSGAVARRPAGPAAQE